MKTLQRIGNWIAEGDTGSSSLSLCAVYLGYKGNKISHPYDSGDFRRCIEFLHKLDADEVNPLLGEIASLDKSWGLIKENWDKLLFHYNRNESKELYQILKKCDVLKDNEIVIEVL